ncbi:MAG: S8 family serine peptidase [Prochlorococcaceae cyanobacterium]
MAGPSFALLTSQVGPIPDLATWMGWLPRFRGRSFTAALPFQMQVSEPLAVASQSPQERNSRLIPIQIDATPAGLGASPWPGGWQQALAALQPAAPEAGLVSSSNGTLSVGGGAGGPDRPGAPGAQPPALDANQIIVQWSPTSTAAERLAALQGIGGSVVTTIHTGLMQQLGQGMVEVISLPPGLSVEQAIRAYSNRPGVELAEADWMVGVQASSNDPYYTTSSLWGMYSSDSPTAAGGSGTTNQFGSQAEQAWRQGYTGSTKVVMGVIDTGIDYTHPDLYLNIWLNQGEIRGLSFFNDLTDFDGDGLITFRDLNHSSNAAFVSDINLNGRIDAGDLLRDSRWADGKDNDGNGYRDDLIGWDFFNNTNDPFRASDGDNHGTHVAGTIGGIGGNGTGVVGVNWDVQLMALKFLGPKGGSTSGAIAAVNYYADITARYGDTAQYVGTSNSWGGGGYSTTLYNAIVNGAEVGNLFVAAAGNSSANNDSTSSFPSNYSTTSALGWDAVVAVASITSSGALSSFSSYGSKTVDLGAPGSSINSTVAGGGYASYSGTSMATPHVSGALALLAAAFPQATPQQLLKALYDGTKATTSLSGKTVTGGRLDVNASLQLLSATLSDGGSSTNPPTYSLAAAANSVNEGGSISFTLTTTNVAENTTLVWKLSGSGITTADVDGGSLQGSLTVGADGKASFSVTLANDLTTEGAETLVAGLFADNTSTTVLSSASVVVNDTSLSPVSSTPLVLWGTTSNDVITGAGGNDQLAGVPARGTKAADLGRGQIDILTGGAGADLFLLADSRGTFYNDGNSRNQGTGDYALIKDFNVAEGDRLQLRAGTQILYRNVTLNGIATTEIFLGNGDNSFSAADELIARLENTALAPGSGVWVLGNQTWTTYV